VAPSRLAELNLDVLVYTGNARPEQWWIDRCREAGVVVTFTQETYSARSQEGYQAGVLDAQFADARCDERGHQGSVCYVVSDGNSGDPNPENSNRAQIVAYGQAVAQTSRRPFFFYGNRYAVDAALEGAAKVPGAPAVSLVGGWLPRTWDFDPSRDLIAQEPNLPTPIDGTDFNTVHREYTITSGDDFLMALTDEEQHRILDFVTAMAQTGVPAYGLPNLFDGQHRILAKLNAGGGGGGVDVDAVVAQVKTAYDSAPNSNEWPTIEAALRAALT
jgi:hypothetical protein